MITAGPSLVPISGQAHGVSQVRTTGFGFAFSTARREVRLPIYCRADDAPRGLSDYLLFERDLPFPLPQSYFFSVQTPVGTFTPLDSLVVALYQGFCVAQPLTEFLIQVRNSLPLAPVCLEPGVAPKAIFRPEITDQGYYLVDTLTHGRTLTAHVGWVCPRDRSTFASVPFFPVGALEFRPRPARVLDEGRWRATLGGEVAVLLRDRLRRAHPAAPVRLLSEEGKQVVLDSFHWTALTRMSRTEARRARVAFVRQHPELMDKPEQLIQKMRQAQLYSQFSRREEITKFLETLIAEAKQTSCAA